MSKQKQYVINVMSRDRVGIVAGVTEAIYKMKGNIDSVSQTVLSGYFTIIMTVSFKKPVDVKKLKSEIGKSGDPGELEVSVKSWDCGDVCAPVIDDCDVFVLSIMGKDQAGIISKISSFLASRNINVIDLYAVAEEDEFVFIGQVMVPPKMDIGQLKIDFESLWKKSGLVVHFQHENIFLATQHVDF
jgi:glycine cleavage system transcriptional repressor